MFEQESIMYYPFRHDANFKESSLNSSGSTLLDSGTSGRPFASSFTGQSSSTNHGGSLQGFNNVQGSYNMQTLSSRNAGLGGSSSGVHQSTGGLPAGRFGSGNLPIGLTQLSQSGLQGHHSMTSRGGLNVVGNHPLSSGMNGANVSGPGLQPSSVALGNRGSLTGLVQMGGSGPRVQSSVGNLAVGSGGAGSNLNRTLSSGVPNLTASRMNMPLNSGGLGGGPTPGRAMSPMLQQNVNSTYSPSGDLLAMISRAVPVSLLGNNSGMQGQMPSANGQLGGLGLGNAGSQNDGAAFDMNDFPELSNRQSSGGGLQNHLAAFRKQGVGVNSLGQQNQEFSIQNEDFPALPGYKAGAPGGNGELTSELHHKERQHENSIAVMQSQPQHYGMGRSTGIPLGVSFVRQQQQQQQQQQHQLSGASSGLATAAADSNHLHADAYPSSHGLPASYHSQMHTSGQPGQISLNSLRSGLSSYDLMHQYEHHQQPHFRLSGHPQQQQQQQMAAAAAAVAAAAVGQQQQQVAAAAAVRGEQQQQQQQQLGLRAAAMQADMQADRFGLLGLLSVIRMTEADLTTLALGTDLTTLGLNLNSRENLYKTFASPWAEGPVKGEPEFTLPACYIPKDPPRLQLGNFARFPQEVLFYIFYSMPKDEAQLYAAHELSNRGWHYHKAQQVWLMRAPNTEPVMKNNTSERGTFLFFDPNSWETSRKENFVLQYDMLEKPPQLPLAVQQS